MTGLRQHRRADALVIGAGVVGAAAALALARAGRRVVLVERTSLAVARGSSAGTARMFVPAAYPDDSYLELGLRALARWREIEASSGETLLQPTGALSCGAFAEAQLPALREAGVDAELLAPAAALSRFGVSVAGAPLLHQPDAGIIRADRARGAILGLARAAGAELRQGEPVRSIVERGDRLEVESERERWHCESVIVAAGPWTRGLLAAAGVEVALSVSRQSVAYLDLPRSSALPVGLIEYDGEEPFALWDPARGLKAGFHVRGPAVDGVPEAGEVERDAIARIERWARARFPGLGARLSGSEACLYTNAPGERFMLERRGRIVIASACNGQGFQFAPETGDVVARLAIEASGVRGGVSVSR